MKRLISLMTGAGYGLVGYLGGDENRCFSQYIGECPEKEMFSVTNN